MLSPKHLQKGELIRIISPAGKVKKEKILPSVDLITQQEFEVLLGKHVFDEHFQFAGTDMQRLQDLQEAMDDPKCKAIICARGGYGSIRIADNLDLRGFQKNPKWLVGFSDVTILHSILQNKGFCSIHGAMPAFYMNEEKPTESFHELIKMMQGEKSRIVFPAMELNRPGIIDAPIVGGNLSILYSLIGTPFDLDTNGKILFIEDLSEYLYHLDRIMHSLKLSGKLRNLKGLLVGQFSSMKDNDSPFGQSVEEIILEAVNEYDYPVCFNFPAGHTQRNLPLKLGANYHLDVSGSHSTLELLE